MTKGPWTSGSDAIGAALTLAVAVTLFGYLGHRLDLVLESSPLVLLIGTALGAFGGFLHVLRVLAPDIHLFGSRGGKRPGSGAGSSPSNTDDGPPGIGDVPTAGPTTGDGTDAIE
jgi:hypothetical protein